MPERQGRTLEGPHDGLSVDEAAARAGVHAQTIRGWIRAGLLPCSRFGPSRLPRIRIHPDDVDDAVRRQLAT